MIDLKDLRIGNYYNWSSEGKNYTYQIEAKDFLNDNYKNFEPIPLTPELLIDCGFIEQEEMSYHLKIDTGFYLVILTSDFSYSFYPDRETYERGDAAAANYFIRHLHQLQNLIHVLTNTELIYNPKQ